MSSGKLKKMVKDENSYLVYLIDTSTPCLLEMRVLYCNSDIKEYLNISHVYYDVQNRVCITPIGRFVLLNVANKGTMDDILCIEGLISSVNKPSTISCSEDEKMVLKERLQQGLANLVRTVAEKVEGTKFLYDPLSYANVTILK